MADVYDRKQTAYDAEKGDVRYSDVTPPQYEDAPPPKLFGCLPLPAYQEAEETKRSLKPRQISMIAIGGAIGECILDSALHLLDTCRWWFMVVRGGLWEWRW